MPPPAESPSSSLAGITPRSTPPPQQLHDDVAQYSAGAAQPVAATEMPSHVYWSAVDIGADVAIEWLSLNGAWYGLCQVHANEPWHFEYLPDVAIQRLPGDARGPDLGSAFEPRVNPAVTEQILRD